MKRTTKDKNLAPVIVLVIFWLLSGIVAGYTLRQNNLTMLRLREEVFTADETGVEVNERLIALQQYVTTHMNTELPKLGEEKAIQLKKTYETLVSAETARVSAERQRIATEATTYCEATLPSVRLTERVGCVASYTAARPVSEKPIPKELYTFDFVSPAWSPDIAGFSLALFLALSASIGIAIIVKILVRNSIKKNVN